MKVLREFSGYCCEWDSVFPGGTYGTDMTKQYRFLPGAFNAALASGKDIIFSRDLNGFAHARTSDGTLRLESDETGLLASVTLLDTPENRELSRLVGNGKTRGWSFTAHPSIFGTRSRREGGTEFVDLSHVGLSQVCVVISKRPRALTRRTPIFLHDRKECHV